MDRVWEGLRLRHNRADNISRMIIQAVLTQSVNPLYMICKRSDSHVCMARNRIAWVTRLSVDSKTVIVNTPAKQENLFEVGSSA